MSTTGELGSEKRLELATAARAWAKQVEKACVMDGDEDDVISELWRLAFCAPEGHSRAAASKILARACLLSDPVLAREALVLEGKPSKSMWSQLTHAIDVTTDLPQWVECVKIVVEQQSGGIDARVMWGCSILHHALREAQEAPLAAVALLDLGASPFKKTKDGQSPLELAIEFGNAPAAERLLEAGATFRDRGTELLLGIASGSPMLVELLLRRGASPVSAAPSPIGGGGSIAPLDWARQMAEEAASSMHPKKKAGGGAVLAIIEAAVEAQEIAASAAEPAKRAQARSL